MRDAAEIAAVWNRSRAARPDFSMAAKRDRALQSLPTEQREAVALHIEGGLTFEEIAEGLGVSVNTVGSRYRYALEKLRKALVPPAAMGEVQRLSQDIQVAMQELAEARSREQDIRNQLHRDASNELGAVQAEISEVEISISPMDFAYPRYPWPFPSPRDRFEPLLAFGRLRSVDWQFRVP